MRNIWIIMSKELKIYFISPIAYVVMAVFLAITDFLFYAITVNYSFLSSQVMRSQGFLPQLNLQQMVFRPTYLNMSVVLLLIMPLLTMRLFAEEKKSRTAELLMTSPVTITEIVLGKFLAAFGVFALMLLLTLHMPLIIAVIGRVDWVPLLPNYVGLLLLGGVFLSLGLFASALTENQIVAAVLSLGIFLLLWLIGVTAQTAGTTGAGAVISYLSMTDHLDNFTKGLLDTRDIVYFGSLILFGLFLTHRVVESQRWK
jgi:ABC-2 type transport system permease protein